MRPTPGQPNPRERQPGRGQGPAAPTLAIVVSRYHRGVTDRLQAGAFEAYGRAGGNTGELVVVDAPGAFELVALSLAAARTGRFDAVVALGCIVKGETRHDQYIAQAVCEGLINVTLVTGVPTSLGVLTVDTTRQARERAGGVHGNKGAEAVDAALATVAAAAGLRNGKSPRIVVRKPGRKGGPGRGGR